MAQNNKNLYTFNDLYIELLDQQLALMNDKFGVCCHIEGVVFNSSPMTVAQENIFLQKMDKFPVSNDTFYPFRTCEFVAIPDFAKRELVNIFLEYKNTFKKSTPTAESLAQAKESLGMLHDVMSDDSNHLLNNISGYDVEMLLLEAKREYQGTEFEQMYESSSSVDQLIVVVEFLSRHPELYHTLEAVKALKQKIRNILKLDDEEYIGF